jgi:hypothetical protein
MAVTSKVERITPEIAKSTLAGHKNFRALRFKKVEQYARIMKSGKWLVGEPITFNDEGGLNNGQHRLHAVILANIPIDFLVVRGVDKALVGITDTNIQRSGSDCLRATGLIGDHCTSRATIMRIIHMGAGENDRPHSSDYPNLYPIYKRAVDFTIECFPAYRKNITRSSIISAWARAYLCKPQEEMRLAIAAEKYFNFKFEDRDESLRLLARYITGPAGASKVGCQSRIDYLKASRALESWLKGEKLKTLITPNYDPFPLPVRYSSRAKQLGFFPSKEKAASA